jgi:hypothetical protein
MSSLKSSIAVATPLLRTRNLPDEYLPLVITALENQYA